MQLLGNHTDLTFCDRDYNVLISEDMYVGWCDGTIDSIDYEKLKNICPFTYSLKY